uniref:uncharacterized protein LOC105758034 n=1 Tax=Odobenus rosmarus divergens TaxID=9708 RepID=UPI00063C3B46|nr:PREDICTED: uncharacterized protein LOC105758034 [Odobenus rosmarus divergens]
MSPSQTLTPEGWRETRVDTVPNPPAPGCRDPEKGAGSGGDSDSQDKDAGVPTSQAAPSLSVPGVPAGARRQGGPHEGGGLGAVGSADAPEPPEKLRQRQGRTPGSPGSQRRAPLSQARAPGPKRSRGDRQRAYGPPAVSDPVRRPAPPRLGRYLSVSGAARLARHCAALPLPAPQWRWPAALRPVPTRPIERATRRSLASRAPSHRGGAPCRRRPPADAAAGGGEPPKEPPSLQGWEETESQGRGGP